MKKIYLLISLMIIGTIANAQINMPSAPVYDAPSAASYNAPARTIKDPPRTNFYVQDADSTPKAPSTTYKKPISKQTYYYDMPEDKKAFYDAFKPEFFGSMKRELMKKGFSESSVNELIRQLEKRYNRTELENATWSCISQYKHEQLTDPQYTDQILKACFADWTQKYINNNKGLAEQILKFPPKEKD
ncbi:MAG: hypothetical protein NC191_04595 [Muribaculaceae bacterium]|nr:hypothetical protein [Muribaculaceae bacterium]